MKAARALYHIARADFLERVRRYSFLLTLGFAVYLGYAAYSEKLMLRLGEYRGVYNSAWVGSLMAHAASGFLTLAGFYIVKKAIRRDQQTRVGRVLATTPMSNTLYVLGKAISNFAVLAAMVMVLAVGAAVMQMLRAEEGVVDFWALLSPLLLLTLPAMAFIAALAVLFETLPGLRGGIGNVIYVFVWALLFLGTMPLALESGHMSAVNYFTDLTGLGSTIMQMRTAVRSIDPQYIGGASLQLQVGQQLPTKRFLWAGMDWNALLLASRLSWMLLAVGVTLLASRFFNRFDPAREKVRLRKPKVRAGTPDEKPASRAPELAPVFSLTPLARHGSRARLPLVVAAELRLILKGRSWWWFAVAGGLLIACAAVPVEAGPALVAAAYIWPVLLWSPLGARESIYATDALVFSSERALYRQFPATWIAGIVLTLAISAGYAIRLLLAGDIPGIEAWMASALFVPGLALALGVWSGSSKPFEAIYTLWWYVGLMNRVPGADFVGVTAASRRPLVYFAATGILIAAAYLGRLKRIALT
jgi:hypothetical protein